MFSKLNKDFSDMIIPYQEIVKEEGSSVQKVLIKRETYTADLLSDGAYMYGQGEFLLCVSNVFIVFDSSSYS